MRRKLGLFVFCALATLTAPLASRVEAHTLSGTVYGGGNPLSGATVTLADADTLATLGATTTTAGGLYSFSVNDGSYNLAIAPPDGSGFNESLVKNVAVSGGNVTQNVVLIAKGSILSGVIRRQDGTPVGGVSVVLAEQASGAQVGTSVTGDDGKYSFSVAPGTYTISLIGHTGSDPRPPGMPYFFEILPAVANLVVDGDTTRDITAPFVLLSGKILDHDGKAVAGVGIEQQEFWIDNSVTPNVVFQISHTLGDAVSDESGNYRIFLFPHKYDLTVVPPAGSDLATTVFKDLSIPAETTRDFTLDRESILSGVIRRVDGTPVGGVSVVLAEQASGARVGTSVTGDNGRYSFSVAPGTYTISLNGHTGGDPQPAGMPYFFEILPAVANLVVDSDTTRDITVPFVLLSGKILDHDGKAVAGVGIEQQEFWIDNSVTPNVVYQISHTLGDAVSDESGNYRIFLFPHKYDLTVAPPAGSDLATTVFSDVSIAAETTRDFTLDRESILSGVIRRQDGTAVGGVSVVLAEQASGARVGTSVTGDNGRYSFSVAPGTYTISLNGHTGGDPQPAGMPYFFEILPAVANLVVDSDTTRDITAPFVSLSGRTTDRNGVAVPGVEFLQQAWWIDYSVTPYAMIQISHTFGDATSADSGAYRMQLFPHAYDLTVQPPAGSGFGQTVVGGLSVTQNMLQNVILDLQDVTAPAIISGPTVKAIADTSAVVEWQTSEPANGGVTYGTSSPPATAVAEAAGYRTLHTRVVSGLSPDTTYYVSVSAADESANGPTVSGIVSFRTRLTPDVTPPVIVDGPIVSGITDEAAVVEWSTDEPTTGEVAYGLTADLGETVADETSSTSHRVVLSGLTADSLYHVRVSATDAFGNGPALSPVIDFYTVSAADTTPPVIVEGPLAIDITDTTATIVWSTDEPATSGVSWNDGTAYDLVSDPALTTTHLVTLMNLQPGTQYFYTVSTSDGLGNGPTLSQEATFTTKSSADTDPPVFTAAPWVHVVNSQKAQIKWQTDEPCDTVVEFGLSAAELVESEGKAGLVINHTIDLNHLDEGTTYFFRARSTDESGNTAASAVMSFYMPTQQEAGTSGPVVTLAPKLVYTSDHEATVLWETDVPTDTVVDYSSAGGPVLRRSEAEKVKIHQVTLTNLSADESYTVTVSGTDARGGEIASLPGSHGAFTADAGGGFAPTTTFSTKADPDAAAPAILSGPAVTWRSDRMAVVRWTTDEIADSVVHYGLSGQPLADVAGDIVDVSAHEVVLTNLDPAATYDFQVASTDPAGNGPTQSAVAQFAKLVAPDTTAPAGSMLINSGATSTRATAVTLNLSATDTGGSGVASMRFRNSTVEPYSAWEPYQTAKSWTLPSGQGTRKVYAQFMDNAGNLSDANPSAAGAQGYVDAIDLIDKTAPTGSIMINNGAVTTGSRTVTLKLSAADAGGSGLGSMRFRNGATDPYSAWEPYATGKAWTLTSGTGGKKVFVQFKDTAGNVSDANPAAAGAQGYADGIQYTGP